MIFSRRRFLQITAGASGATLAMPTIFGSPARAGEDPILVGGLHEQSGAAAAAGIPMAFALNLAVDEVNSAGGLLGRPLKVINYDTQTSTQMMSQYAQQLVLKDKVAVVFGGFASPSREAARPTFDRFHVPYFYNVFYEGGVCDRNTFCIGTTPAQTVGKLVPYAMDGKRKKIYIIAADYSYGQITAKWMSKYVQENGGEVVAADFFPLEVTDFGSSISKIQAAKPDLLLSALVGGNHTSFYRQWTAAGMKDQIPIASSTYGVVNEQATLDQRESDGILSCFGYFEELETPANRAFVDRMRSAHPDCPYISEVTAATYEAVHLWAEGVKKAGTIEQMPLIEALESGLSYEGPSGTVTIDKATHHTARNAIIAEARDRKMQVMKTFANVQPIDTAMVCDLIKNPNEKKQFVIDL